jgi:hypothetical protein
VNADGRLWKIKRTGRQKMKVELAFANDNRVTGIITTLYEMREYGYRDL